VTVSGPDLDRAANAIRAGKTVVYPTETVYGLGSDALDPAAVERIYTVKRRNRDDPISLAVPAIEAVETYVRLEERERSFMRAFLPGPVTVVCERRPAVPDVLTGGRDRVGVRIPDHPVATALLERVAPLTATSANVSGRDSVREISALSPSIREAVAVILDGGETPGGASTVVDVRRGLIHRRGAMAEAVSAWLREK
jgi:L-threonylcarbamoyladenylate synthase